MSKTSEFSWNQVIRDAYMFRKRSKISFSYICVLYEMSHQIISLPHHAQGETNEKNMQSCCFAYRTVFITPFLTEVSILIFVLVFDAKNDYKTQTKTVFIKSVEP